MARSRRRKTFWMGYSGSLEFEGGDGEGGLMVISDSTLADIDPTPTLVRIVGNVLVSAARSGAGLASSFQQTQATAYGMGLMCQEGISTVYTSPLDELGDERWLWTDMDGIHATSQSQALYDGSSPSGEQWHQLIHIGGYPRKHVINARARRKFEDPCNLVMHFHAVTPFGNDTFGDVQFQVALRMLFLAS